jgi:hypothetical protein
MGAAAVSAAVVLTAGAATAGPSLDIWQIMEEGDFR